MIPQTPPDSSSQRNITLYETEVIPNDIVLHQMALLVSGGLAEVTLRQTTDPMEVLTGVYPQVGDVDLASAKYGPTGVEYQGTLLQPVITDVKLNIQYGADGTEFTGTLTGGTTSKIKRWDGNQWIACNSRKMWDGLEWKGV